VAMTYDPNLAAQKSEAQAEGELDHSAELRLELWADALELFRSNPIIGTGFNTYAYMKRIGNYADTHNIYVKVLIETGVIGLALFLWLLFKTYRAGYRLFRVSRDPFFAALGLGLAVWVVTNSVCNLFGDRWTYLQINGYMWTLAGFVARAAELESAAPETGETAATPAGELAAAV
jgi:putative inorganic carbon (HCO3(-)) transporter